MKFSLSQWKRNVHNDQTVIEHLGELRKHLIYSLIGIAVCFIAALVLVTHIYRWLTLPLRGVKLVLLGPGDVIHVYFMVAGVVALTVALPFLLLQLWLFIKPALSPHERKTALGLLPFASIMFLVGTSFAYFVIFPILLKFLIQLASGNFQMLITADNYFSFMVNLLLPFGLIFEMPVVVMFLTQIGILTPQKLRQTRKYAYMGMIVLASIISPPEIISHLSVDVPMMILYEISVVISRTSYRRREKRRAQEAQRFNDTPSSTTRGSRM